MSGQIGPTLREFLKTALIPCGHTLYVWGGGWNEEDTGAGIEARTFGESPRWRAFFDTHADGYDYKFFRFSCHDGLDCSGYIGWVLFNLLEQPSSPCPAACRRSATSPGRTGKAMQDPTAAVTAESASALLPHPEGYVMKSTSMAKVLSQMGLGRCFPHEAAGPCRPGDIVSIEGHVYLSLGTCEDGSIVLLHSSPQAGVQISGTCMPQAGGEKGIAWTIADRAMQKSFPQCHALFGTKLCGEIYHTGVVFRWDLTDGPLTDPEGLTKLPPDKLLKYLLEQNN